MHLKRYRRSTLKDALRAVREELGPDALVLSTREVTAVTAQPAPGSWTDNLPLFGGVLLMGSALCGMVVVRRRRDEPFIVTIGPD